MLINKRLESQRMSLGSSKPKGVNIIANIQNIYCLLKIKTVKKNSQICLNQTSKQINKFFIANQGANNNQRNHIINYDIQIIKLIKCTFTYK